MHGDTFPIDKPDLFVFTEREPLGVVAAVVPWNSQLFLTAVKLGPALAAGNTVVAQGLGTCARGHPRFCPPHRRGRLPARCGQYRDRLWRSLRPGAYHPSFGDTHQLYRRSGKQLVTSSATPLRTLPRFPWSWVASHPSWSFEDADVESAANGSIAGIFGASGQSCVAGSRLYLQESIYDDFMGRMLETAQSIKIGDPLAEETQMGPLATMAQIKHIERQVEIAKEEGATILHGGQRPPHLNAGWYYEPTIVECPAQSNTIVDTELFGPVLSVQRFKSEEEVLGLANDTKYGLAAGIFSRDIARAHRVAKAVRAGIVWVNTYRVVSPIAEFGGFKDSGQGRESGFQAIYDYTRPKTVWVNTSSEPHEQPLPSCVRGRPLGQSSSRVTTEGLAEAMYAAAAEAA